MSEPEGLTLLFESHRSHLRAVAYRMLGSATEADDAVQEAWLRLNGSNTSDVANLGGWLTTVVARVCLDILRSRRREEALDAEVVDSIADSKSDPEQETLLADSVGVALLVVLDTLSPAERVAFVLHDVFDLPFDEIAPIVDRTPDAARQLASRARRRVRGGERTSNADFQRQRVAVDSFLAALRAGDVEGLLAVLDPDVLVRMDAAPGAPPREFRGAANWARGATAAFSRFAPVVQPAVVNGTVGLVIAHGGKLSRALTFTVANGKITQVEIITDRDRLQQLDLSVLDQ
ncbi:MAG TPA: sigma-70 family RNA polymerase sigma factor [Pyrinomonadaceae bacterium]|nr:sigma-70 family RNA polymerase sigma factor [Pyrinomonadaceae bacterium]